MHRPGRIYARHPATADVERAVAERASLPREDDPDKPAVPRAARITREVVYIFGLYPLCVRCGILQRNNVPGTRGHSKSCILRL